MRAQLLDLLMRKLGDESTMALARLNEREEDVGVWIRAASADGRLSVQDPVFAAQQLHSLVKGFAFWPQLAMGQPPLTKREQKQVAEPAADMFFARYERRT